MRKLWALVLCGLVATSYAEEPLAMAVGTASIKVLPQRDVESGVAWTNGITLAQGQMTVYQGRLYMAEEALAPSVDAPVHFGGTANGLRFVPKMPRAGFIIQNTSGNDVWLAFNNAAVVDRGVLLEAGGTLMLFASQDAVYAIAGSAGNTLLLTELTTYKR